MVSCILLRFGEIALKSKNSRPIFEKRLVQAVKIALKRNGFSGFRVSNIFGRFLLQIEGAEKCVPILRKIPGIESFSVAQIIEFNDLNGLAQKCAVFAGGRVEGKTFAVKATRTGRQSNPFTSMDLQKELGSILFAKSSGVDLKNPQETIFVDVRDNRAFVFTEIFEGLKGLPPKTSGKVLCLFSGGIDSPVAAFEMLRKGCVADFLLVNLGDEMLLGQVGKIYNFLAENYCYNFRPNFFCVDGREIVEKLRETVPDNLRQIAFKMALYEIAGKVSNDLKCVAIVSGESLGQKSSQTLHSLAFLDKCSIVPVLRPLLSMDKTEILARARRVGTLAASEKVVEYCSLSSGPVKTKPKELDRKKIVLPEEEILGALKQMQCFEKVPEFSGKASGPLQFSGDFESIDVRPESERKNSKIGAGFACEAEKISSLAEQLSRDKTYVLVCAFGVQSEEAAKFLRMKGFKAFGLTVAEFKELKKQAEVARACSVS